MRAQARLCSPPRYKRPFPPFLIIIQCIITHSSFFRSVHLRQRLSQGFVPPHIRRKGLQMPPIESMSRKFVSLLSFPYLPWASFDWRKYAKYAAGDMIVRARGGRDGGRGGRGEGKKGRLPRGSVPGCPMVLRA